MGKDIDGKKLISDAKNKINEKDGNMKWYQKDGWKKFFTVFITLVAVASLVGAFLGGVNYQKSINEQVKSEVKALSAVVSKE